MSASIISKWTARSFLVLIVVLAGLPLFPHPVLAATKPTAAVVSPASSITLQAGQSQTFTVKGDDVDSNLRGTEWYVNGAHQKSNFTLSGKTGQDSWSYTFNQSGSFKVEALVFDNTSPTNLYSSPAVWTANVTGVNPQSVGSPPGAAIIYYKFEGIEAKLKIGQNISANIKVQNSGSTETTFDVSLAVIGPIGNPHVLELKIVSLKAGAISDNIPLSGVVSAEMPAGTYDAKLIVRANSVVLDEKTETAAYMVDGGYSYAEARKSTFLGVVNSKAVHIHIDKADASLAAELKIVAVLEMVKLPVSLLAESGIPLLDIVSATLDINSLSDMNKLVKGDDSGHFDILWVEALGGIGFMYIGTLLDVGRRGGLPIAGVPVPAGKMAQVMVPYYSKFSTVPPLPSTTNKPVSTAVTPPSSIPLQVGQSQTFTVKGDDVDGNLRGTEWYVNGAHQKSNFNLSGKTGQDSWSYTFNQAGAFKIEALVFDNTSPTNLYSSPAVWSVNVTNVTQPPGVAQANPSIVLFDPQLTGSSVSINGVTMPGTQGTTITKIRWSWGDGSSDDQWFPASHNYPSTGGSFIVTATSYQSDGLTTSKSLTVTVPPVRMAGRDVTVTGITLETRQWNGRIPSSGSEVVSIFNSLPTNVSGYSNSPKSLIQFSNISNQGSFGGVNTNIAFHYRIVFNDSTGGNLSIRIGPDFDAGGVLLVDGKELQFRNINMWWSANWSNPNQILLGTVPVAAGTHVVDVYGFEGCCDGTQEGQYDFGSGFKVFTAAVGSGSSPAMPASPPAAPAPTTTSLAARAYISPGRLNLTPGAFSTVSILVDPRGRGVSSGEVIVAFDSAALEIRDISPGEMLGAGAIVGKKNIDNKNGTGTIALARSGQTTAPTSSGALLKLGFAAKPDAKPGEYRVSLSIVGLADENYRDMPGTDVAHLVIVIGGQRTDINGDSTVDYRDLAVLGAAYGSRKGDTAFNSLADLNTDGVVDYKDLAMLGAAYGTRS